MVRADALCESVINQHVSHCRVDAEDGLSGGRTVKPHDEIPLRRLPRFSQKFRQSRDGIMLEDRGQRNRSTKLRRNPRKDLHRGQRMTADVVEAVGYANALYAEDGLPDAQ